MATRAQIRRALEQTVEFAVREIAAELIPELRRNTPKDTQYHSSRWVGAAGSPPASRPTPPTRGGRAAALSFAQQNASLAAVRTFRLGQGRVYVSNDGNYINVLNAREGNFVLASANRAVAAAAPRINARARSQ